MPSRLIREGILTSDRIDQLDAAGEVFYRRLMSKVDDHGLYDARPLILRASLFPLRVDRVREADISRWIAACEKAGLIALYSHDGKPFLQMRDTRWSARSEPKYPLPSSPGSAQMTTENSCAQPKTLVPVFVGVGVVGDVACAPAGALFEEFWKSYPKKKAKDDARKAFEKRSPTRQLLDSMIAAIRQQCLSVDWKKDGGQFIPYPATWLNDGRWQDSDVVDVPQGANPQIAETRARLDAESARDIVVSPERLAAARAVAAAFRASKVEVPQ